MPVGTGMIGSEIVPVLRDTGCCGAVIKKKIVKEYQFTGKSGFMLLADNTLKRAPLAKLHVKTPFYRGEIKALCLDDCVYDLIIGNLQAAVISVHKLFDKNVENLKEQVSNLDAPQDDKNCITATSEEIQVKESKKVLATIRKGQSHQKIIMNSPIYLLISRNWLKNKT